MSMDKKLTSAVYAAVEKAYDHRCDIEDAADEILEIIKADRKRRGEPVGYIMPTALKRLKAGGNAIVGGVSQGCDVPIYTAPQPAESCESLMSDKTACGSENGNCDSQPAEPEPCFCDRMYPDSNPDASCGDCPTRDYKKPAEPVKVPSEAEEALRKAYESLRELEKQIVLDANQISGAAAANFAANRVLALLNRYGQEQK